MIRKVIRIRAEDSPNVRLGIAQRRAGTEPTYETLIPGVLSFREYEERRRTWDARRQTIGLDAEFPVDAGLLLFPPEWRKHAVELHRKLTQRPEHRRAKGVGIDTAEGGDSTAFAAVDEFGLIELIARKTPDTAAIFGQALEFVRKHGVEAHRVVIGLGGGGKQLADRLRSVGLSVGTVHEGGAPTLPIRHARHLVSARREIAEDRGEYADMRSELYGETAKLLDPFGPGGGWALPGPGVGPAYERLHHEMEKVPKTWDDRGRFRLIPKHNPRNPDDPDTLVKLMGHSPDELEAVNFAVRGMQRKSYAATAGAIV